MPGVQGSMPLKHDPTVDLITAKPNKQKSISAGKVKEEEEEKEEIRSKWLKVVVAAAVGTGGGGAIGGIHVMNVCLLPQQVDMQYLLRH